MIWHGKVCEVDYVDEEVLSIRGVLKMIEEDEEVEATTIGTVGERGYDGFLYAVVV